MNIVRLLMILLVASASSAAAEPKSSYVPLDYLITAVQPCASDPGGTLITSLNSLHIVVRLNGIEDFKRVVSSMKKETQIGLDMGCVIDRFLEHDSEGI